MKYRVMKVGDKYAAQIINDRGEPTDYIKRDSADCYRSPDLIVTYCLVDTIDQAKEVGEKFIYAPNLLAAAVEATS